MQILGFLQHARDRIRRYIGIKLFDRVNLTSKPDSGPVVIIRWDAKLGDSIISSWVPREIRRAQPEREIWIVTTPEVAPLFREHFKADKVIEVPKRPSYGELKRLAHHLGPVGYLVHLGKQLKMKDIYFLSRVDTSHIVGMDDSLACIDIKLGKASAGLHFADKFALLLARMGIPNPDTRYIVPMDKTWETKVAEWWPANQRVIAFNPYGSGSARRLLPERILPMLEIMLAACSHQLCLLFPPGMEREVSSLRSGVSEPERILLSPDAPSLGGLFTQLRHCRGLVSVDTATIHIAAGLALPILGLYNPDLGGGGENFDEWHPNRPDAMVLFSKNLAQQDINSLDLDEFGAAFRAWVLSSPAG
ncbi:glycosyltransferase family 9 protein [Aeromonas rivipollensis]|uniref:glycosyltransferase family 9 protein n=1 Tax=Aeromonas rivipollensis TaxID=948519 RepID=UPI0038F05FAD